MTDNIGYGKKKRREGNLRSLAGEQTFRYTVSCRTVRGESMILSVTVGMLSVRCWTA